VLGVILPALKWFSAGFSCARLEEPCPNVTPNQINGAHFLDEGCVINLLRVTLLDLAC
jgi:hypothetical protein